MITGQFQPPSTSLRITSLFCSRGPVAIGKLPLLASLHLVQATTDCIAPLFFLRSHLASYGTATGPVFFGSSSLR